MVKCPKCSKDIEEKTTVCECGAILFGQVTNIAPWETETVFRSAGVAAKKNFAPVIAVVALVALCTLFVALPKLTSSIGDDETRSDAVQTSPTQIPTRSDLIPTDDLIQPEIAAGPDAASGAFEFTPAGARIQPATSARAVRLTSLSVAATNESASASTNPLDAQLLADSTEGKAKTKADPADCKPETTASLKKVETEPAVAEVKSPAKTTSSPYVQGPRGGCFIVTASGGKKYVDRALCAPAAAAARQ